MRTLFTRFSPIITLLMLLILASCGSQSPTTSNGQLIVRLGYFPNLTHAVALVGVGRGTFQQAFGSNVKLETKTCNAGPALIEALFAGDIDIGYVGPNPAINGYVKSHGTALRIIAGASSGGALFVVQSNEHIQTPKDLANKTFATPQLGGTQDVALRYYLQQNNLAPVDKGGNVKIEPTDSAKSIINSEIKRITGKGMLTNELDIAFNNLTITYDPLTTTLTQSADRAYSLGFLGTSKPDLSGIYNLGLLNQVLASKGLAT